MTDAATPLARKGPTQPPRDTISPQSNEVFDEWLIRLRVMAELASESLEAQVFEQHAESSSRGANRE